MMMMLMRMRMRMNIEKKYFRMFRCNSMAKLGWTLWNNIIIRSRFYYFFFSVNVRNLLLLKWIHLSLLVENRRRVRLLVVVVVRYLNFFFIFLLIILFLLFWIIFFTLNKSYGLSKTFQWIHWNQTRFKLYLIK